MHVYGMIATNKLMALFTNRGSAVDAYPKFYAPNYHIDEMDVPEPEDGLNLYFSEEGDQRIWYTSYETAKESGVHFYRIQIEETVQPYKDGHVFQCLLERGEKGLYTRINNHPEEFGSNAKGKVFLVDRSWADAVPGIANVRVRRETQRYGFIVGEMVPLTVPDPYDLAVFLRDELNGSLDYRMLEWHQTETGHYVSESYDEDRTCYAVLDGEIQQIPDLNGTVIKREPVKDFLAAQFFRDEKDEVLRDLSRAVIPEKFLCKARDVRDVKNCGDEPLLTQALQYRLIRGFVAAENITVYTFTDCFQHICRFPAEMIHMLAEQIEILNRQAVKKL